MAYSIIKGIWAVSTQIWFCCKQIWYMLRIDQREKTNDMILLMINLKTISHFILLWMIRRLFRTDTEFCRPMSVVYFFCMYSRADSGKQIVTFFAGRSVHPVLRLRHIKHKFWGPNFRMLSGRLPRFSKRNGLAIYLT